MFSKFKKKLFLLSLILAPNKSWSDQFFMEPYVGFSKLEVRNQVNDYKDIADNYTIGVRAGVFVGNSFLLGIDYHSGGPYQFGSLINRGAWSTKSLGAVLGFDYKVIRFWYGYYPSARVDDSANNLSYTGTAQKIGFTIRINQKLSVHLEMMPYYLNKQVIGSSSSDYSYYSPLETNAMISVPVGF